MVKSLLVIFSSIQLYEILIIIFKISFFCLDFKHIIYIFIINILVVVIVKIIIIVIIIVVVVL